MAWSYVLQNRMLYISIRRQQSSPSLQLNDCQGWNGFVRGENGCQWFVVCNKMKFPALQVLIETLHTKYEGQCFVPDLWVILLTEIESVGGKDDQWTFVTHWVQL